jgi:Domain of unknown function (DUF4145)
VPLVVPSHIAGDLHALRSIGNFAAHPLKSTNTGEIVDVENEEAEWNLDVLELLFDFYFVQPAISARRKAALNKKLKEAGKATREKLIKKLLEKKRNIEEQLKGLGYAEIASEK